MRPGRARDRQERAALLARFRAPSPRCRARRRRARRWHRRPASPRPRRRARPPRRARRRPRRCRPCSTRLQPGHQRGAVLDEAFLDRGLDAVAVAEGADRIGRRQPGQQAVERIGSAMALGMQRAVPMVGIVIVLAVGAAFGIERRAHLADLGAQALQHVDDDVIVADQDAVGVDLRRQVAIAEMPGEPREATPGRGRAPRPGPPRPPSPRRSRPPPASARRRCAARSARSGRAGSRAPPSPSMRSRRR